MIQVVALRLVHNTTCLHPIYKTSWRKVCLRLSDIMKAVALKRCPTNLSLVKHHLVLSHGCYTHCLSCHLTLIEHSLNIKKLLLVRTKLRSQVSNLLLFIVDLGYLSVVLSFKSFLCLREDFLLVKSPFLLVIKDPSEFNYLLLLNGCLIFKNLPQLLLIAL